LPTETVPLTSAPCQAGPPGSTQAWQGALVKGTVSVGKRATLVVGTPPVRSGHYAVVADLTVAGSGSNEAGNDKQASEIDCWITPNSAGLSSNRDGVRVAATIGTGTQTLSLNDVVTTTLPSDQIDLACELSSGEGRNNPMAVVTHASILATQVAGVTTRTVTAPA
jgi:hypothetical protein